MSVRISLINDQVPYYIEICYGADVFSLNLIWFRYFAFDSNEKLEIDLTIEPGVIYPIPLYSLSHKSRYDSTSFKPNIYQSYNIII